MSIDKPRGRKDITGEISKREQEKKKRLEGTKKVVQDKKTEAGTAKALKFSGTSEGTQEIKRAVKAAGEATDKEFEKQEKDLRREVFDKAKKTEKELRSRADAVKADTGKLKDAVSRIDTKAARSQVQTAERGAGKDREFLDQSRKQQERDRVSGEKDRDRQRSNVKGARITFKP